MMNGIFEQFEHGSLTAGQHRQNLSSLPWIEHKEFAGVFLKTIVSTQQTQGLLSCHLVRINPHGKIGLHTHPAQIELHEVMAGSGACITERGEIPYGPGSLTILAHGTAHEVQAGSNGLCLFAKFITVQP